MNEKDKLIELAESVIEELELDDSMETLDEVQTWIMKEHSYYMFETSVSELVEGFKNTLCPQCRSTQGKNCGCFTRERL